MAYQNVGTPRFYINLLEWLGYSKSYSPLMSTLPVEPQNISGVSWQDSMIGDYNYADPMYIPVDSIRDNGFIMILGHDLSGKQIKLLTWTLGEYSNLAGLTSIVNLESNTPSLDNFSLGSFNGTGLDGVAPYFVDPDAQVVMLDVKVGSIIIGSYYDMPHSPDLKLTMTREMDGVKRVRTKGGSDLTKHQYVRPPLWTTVASHGVKRAPWEMATNASNVSNFQAMSRVGRRTWDLKFSYFQDSDMFGPNQSLSNKSSEDMTNAIEGGTADSLGYELGDLFTDGNFQRTIVDDINFYSQVIHRTNGGQLPFVFQPDNNNNNPDNFAICKFDMNSFEFKQVANGVYNVKLKIREVW